MKETIFHKIVRHEIPADVVFEDDEVVAFHDIHPVAPVHVLLIPKKFIESIATLTTEDEALVGRIHSIARDIALKLGIAHTGYRLVTNVRGDGGQEIPYLHFHLIGGKKLGSKIGG